MLDIGKPSMDCIHERGTTMRTALAGVFVFLLCSCAESKPDLPLPGFKIILDDIEGKERTAFVETTRKATIEEMSTLIVKVDRKTG